MMGADFYQTLDELAAATATAASRASASGANSVIRTRHHRQERAHRLGRAHRQRGGRRRTHDGAGYFIRDGIVIVPKNGVIPDGTTIP